MRNWRVSGDEGLNAVQRVRGDAAAVAQSGREFAVVHGAPSECGLREPGLTTIVGDFLEQLLGVHGIRLCFLDPIDARDAAVRLRAGSSSCSDHHRNR